MDIRTGSTARRLLTGLLHVAMAMAVVLSLGVAADYGVAPVHAAAVVLPPDQARVAGSPVPAGGLQRIPGHVLTALTDAQRVPHQATFGQKSRSPGATRPLTLTLVLKRDDQAGFERYLADVYDPRSPHYHEFLTPSAIAARFGPSRQTYQELVRFLAHSGLQRVHGSRNRLTLTVRGSRKSVETAFATHIDDYQLGSRTFYANDSDPAFPSALATHVESVSGLSDFSKPYRVDEKVLNTFCNATTSNFSAGNFFAVGIIIALAIASEGILIPALVLAEENTVQSLACVIAKSVVAQNWLNNAYNRDQNYINSLSAGPYNYIDPVTGQPGIRGIAPNKSQLKATRAAVPTNLPGTGQTIGLLEFDAYHTSDVTDMLSLISSNGGYGGTIANLSVVPVNGGVASPGSGEGEVLLDINAVMSIAPGAKVVVYEEPFAGTAADYSNLFNAMINGGVSVISNSWASCEDQMTLAEVTGIDSVLKAAAASGISVFNGTGDQGSSCLDGSANTVSVPADSPNATAVGATTLAMGAGYTYLGETWWNGSSAVPQTGQGGFGVSKFFGRPDYQTGFTASAMRSLPDVSIAGDPINGSVLCQADAGGCPTGTLSGGTSLAAPTWAAYAALLNQGQGKNLGSFNALLYPLGNSAAFHDAASMNSDFAHVGLGSPNLNVMRRLLSHAVLGAPTPANSQVLPLIESPPVFNGSSLAASADGTSQAGVLVTLVDANGYTVSGKTVTLAANSATAKISPASGVSGPNGTVAFQLTDMTAENLTLTATDATDGVVLKTSTLSFGVPSASSAGITGGPSTVPADGQTAATITVTLKDSLNRPAPGKTVSLSNGGSNAVMTGPLPSVTNASGQIQFAATDLVNETVTFTAVDVTDGNLPVPGSVTVTYSNSATNSCNFGVPPAAASGFTVKSFITGLPAATSFSYGNVNFGGCAGADNPIFTSDGKALVPDFVNGGLYQIGQQGGAVSTANLLNTLNPAISGVVYGKDGSLYYSQSGEGGFIAQLDPSTGAQLRVVAANLTCPAGLSVDPLSGDLFFDDECTGGGTDDPTIYRIVDPANTDASRPTSVVPYATLPTTPNGGMAFAPNGTLYAVSGYYYVPNAPVEQVSGTNAATVTVTPITGVTSDFGIAIGQLNADGSVQSLIVEPAGTLSEIPIATPGSPTVIATGGPGVGVIGPDGCMYTAHTTAIYRIAPTNGGCAFTPTSPAPSIKLTPATVSPNPAQGGAQTFTATLQNVDTASAVPVTFLITGANGQTKLADTNAAGSASLTYSALNAGSDSVTAVATVDGTLVTSNAVPVTWVAGQHVTFLSLNGGPQGGTIGQAVTVSASLADVSAAPAVSLPGQTISFTLGGSTCTGTTNHLGTATCSFTPSQAGVATLTVTFTGSSTLAAANATIGFRVSVAPAPAPTVSISVSPSSVAAGSPAKLTWSSTNATACAASGAWSGAEATAGTQTVTPTGTGNYSYTLNCSGAGGSASATAVLSATLVAVTVTAHSGGGGITGPLLAALALLVLLRLRAAEAGVGLRRWVTCLGLCACLIVAGGSARADQATTDAHGGDTAASSWVDSMYVGIRVGALETHLTAGNIDAGLASLGYPGIESSTHDSAPAGTVYLGYEVASHLALEFGYTHRSADVATLNGTVGSAADIAPLLRDTTEMIRGLGNIFSLSFRPRVEVAPKLLLDARVGGFFWDTKTTVQALDKRFDNTHAGGGITVGGGLSFRVWRRLEAGVGVDFYRGIPNDIGTFYSGTLEWRFGR